MRRKTTFGAAIPALVVILLVIAAVGAVTLLIRRGSSEEMSSSIDVFVVERGAFDITTPSSGELAALRQEEIRSQLESRSAIMEIVAEGTNVEEGDLLIRLNDEALVERIKDAEIDFKDAQNAQVNAKSNLDIRRQERQAALDAADLEVKLAELALLAWQEGEEISLRRGLVLAIETAEKDFARVEEVYEKSVELEQKKFVSRDEMKQDEIQMIRARAALETARLDLDVYQKYLFEQDKATKEADVDQALDKRARVEEEFDAKVRIAESDLESQESRLVDREDRLERFREQLGYCTMHAPCSGLVVYASSLQEGRGWRNEGQPPQVGTELSRNELVMVIPDVAQMVAEVKVSEALSGQIEQGQPAVIVSDALPDQALRGEVLSVGVLAESGGWRDPNRRDYTVRVLLEGSDGLGLKPSMRCRADIYVGQIEDALFVPIQSIFREGPVAFVYAPVGGGYAQRAVSLGQASELYIEVLEGVEEGDVVLMREPRLEEVIEKIDFDVEIAGSSAWGGGNQTAGRPGGSRGDGKPGRPQGAVAEGERHEASASDTEGDHAKSSGGRPATAPRGED